MYVLLIHSLKQTFIVKCL